MSNKRGYTDEDLAAVSDNPEWTEEDFVAARPFKEVFPELAASLKSAQEQQRVSRAKRVPVEIDRDVVDRFQASGPGWEARINAELRRAAGL